ncbi:MAG: PQQ-binding-like beta-propeller repeat protein [Anaerolineales bacterium]
MKTKVYVMLFFLAGLGLLLSGCASDLVAGTWPGVSADEARAYVAAGSFVYAVDLQTGQEVWRFPEKASTANPFYATPALTPDGEQLIVAGFNHILYSLDPVDGTINWEFNRSHDRYYAAPLIADELIYAASADYNLYAVTFDGDLAWQFSASQAIWSTPVSDGARLYFGALDRTVYALDARRGSLVWKQTLDSAILASPALGAEGQLYVASMGGRVYAFDSESGAALWPQPFQAEGQVWAAPFFLEGRLYVADVDGVIYTLDPATGRESQPRLHAGGTIVSAPRRFEQTLIFGTEDGALFLLTLPDEVQTFEVDGRLYGTPALVGETVLVAPYQADSPLIAVTLQGARRWSFTPER